MKLLSILNEIIATRKDEILSGTQHNIYFSKLHPNRLFKVGDEYIIKTWSEIFKKYPKYFPIIYRMGKMRRGNKFYVEIEKLETNKVLEDWNKIEETLELIGYLDIDNSDSLDMMIYENRITEELLTDLKSNNKGVYLLLVKWITFISHVDSILRNEGYDDFDIHRYNFGYDSTGKIKCLDI